MHSHYVNALRKLIKLHVASFQFVEEVKHLLNCVEENYAKYFT